MAMDLLASSSSGFNLEKIQAAHQIEGELYVIKHTAKIHNKICKRSVELAQMPEFIEMAAQAKSMKSIGLTPDTIGAFLAQAASMEAIKGLLGGDDEAPEASV